MMALTIDKMFSEMVQSTQPDYASLLREFLISSTLRTTGVRLGSFQLSNSRLHRWIWEYSLPRYIGHPNAVFYQPNIIAKKIAISDTYCAEASLEYHSFSRRYLCHQ